MNEAMKIFDLARTRKIEFDPDVGGCNTEEDIICRQVHHNIRLGHPQAQVHPNNDATALIVAGGPSLESTEKDLVRAQWEGGKVVALNGAYQWCIDRNIKPSAMVMLDARQFNSRFVETPVDGCRYLLGGQCHPDTFEKCRDRDVWIWHALSGGEQELAILNEYYFKRFHAVTIGVTVGILSITLMRMLGFSSMELFGLDSCFLDGRHHAYPQPENDADRRFPVWLRPENRDELAERFVCSPWHVKQAETFMQLIRERGDSFRLKVHGNGLLEAILRNGAKIQLEEKSDE